APFILLLVLEPSRLLCWDYLQEDMEVASIPCSKTRGNYSAASLTRNMKSSNPMRFRLIRLSTNSFRLCGSGWDLMSLRRSRLLLIMEAWRLRFIFSGTITESQKLRALR